MEYPTWGTTPQMTKSGHLDAKAVAIRWFRIFPWLLIAIYGALSVLDMTGLLPAERWSPFSDAIECGRPSEKLATNQVEHKEEKLAISQVEHEEEVMLDNDAWPFYMPQVGVTHSDPVASRSRMLGGGGGSSGSSGGGHDGPRQDDALIYLFATVVIGSLLLHLSTIHMFESMQQTVALFVIGVIAALIMHPRGGDLGQKIDRFGWSYNMWMDIEPHLLLFTLLPGLLTGDAMTIDTVVARRVAGQCVWLAGPGVIINSFLTGGFLYYYLQYDWDFMLCLTLGSIFAATDPVAVVGLLKELGASPILTAQIQGESLLNDGTAIVLWTVSYDIYKGAEYDAIEIIVFGVTVVMMALLLGFAIGWVFSLWIRASSSRFSHYSPLIQISLTLCCAYTSFVIAEGVIHISGVLCTVASALVLADNMWPDIVHPTSMHDVWHTLEHLGNTIIFFLAGCLFGNCMLDIEWFDYFHLFVIYLSQLILRANLMFASRPILKYLSPDRMEVTLSDAAVMTWGGLRGAVGLALAIVVYREKGGGNLSPLNASRVLFYTGGIACLTLFVNATTCPALVERLGITKTPEARRRLLLGLTMQMHKVIENAGKHNSEAVRASINHLIDEIYEHISGHLHDRVSLSDLTTTQQCMETFRKIRLSIDQPVNPRHISGQGSMRGTISGGLDKAGSFVSRLLGVSVLGALPNQTILMDLQNAIEVFEELGEEHAETLMVFSADPVRPIRAGLQELLEGITVDGPMLRSVNEVFLSLVSNVYWELISQRNAISDEESQSLLRSITSALEHPEEQLMDLDRLCALCQIDMDEVATVQYEAKASTTDRWIKFTEGENKGRLRAVVDSSQFNLFMCVLIVSNGLVTAVEETSSAEDKQWTGWFAIELFWVIGFTVECVLKIISYKMAYFQEFSNKLDFGLVLIGVAGSAVDFYFKIVETSGDTMSRLKFVRLFRMLRLLRLTRLIKFFWLFQAMLRGKRVIAELAETLAKIACLNTFAVAHMKAQERFLDFFGGEDSSVLVPEEARVLLNSHCNVCKAKVLAAKISNDIEPSLLRGLRALKANMKCARVVEHYIEEAEGSGVISSREAEMFLHPFHHYQQHAQGYIHDVCHGILTQEIEDLGIEVVEETEVKVRKFSRSYWYGQALSVEEEGGDAKAAKGSTEGPGDECEGKVSDAKASPSDVVLDEAAAPIAQDATNVAENLTAEISRDSQAELDDLQAILTEQTKMKERLRKDIIDAQDLLESPVSRVMQGEVIEAPVEKSISSCGFCNDAGVRSCDTALRSCCKIGEETTEV